MDKVTLKVLANFGYANYLDHGGMMLIERSDGYPHELEIVEVKPSDSLDPGEDDYTVSTICLDKPVSKTVHRFHQREKGMRTVHREWYVGKLKDVASSMGCDWREIYRNLLSSDMRRRAMGYCELIGYFGAYAFDQYPNTFTRQELIERYGCKDTYHLTNSMMEE